MPRTENARDELSALLKHVTVQDVLLGMLCVSVDHRMNSSRSRMMAAIYSRCQDVENVPPRFRELFEGLRTGGRSSGFFHGGISMWSDRVESSMGFLTLCDGVGWGCQGNSSYFTLDSSSRAKTYLAKYFPDMNVSEREFLMGLSREVNGR